MANLLVYVMDKYDNKLSNYISCQMQHHQSNNTLFALYHALNVFCSGLLYLNAYKCTNR